MQTKTGVGSSHPLYPRSDSGSQGEQEQVLVQAESRESRKATPSKVQANVFQQDNVCIEYMKITEDDERKVFRVRCVLFTFFNT